jgi:hypothetical protein
MGRLVRPQISGFIRRRVQLLVLILLCLLPRRYLWVGISGFIRKEGSTLGLQFSIGESKLKEDNGQFCSLGLGRQDFVL